MKNKDTLFIEVMSAKTNIGIFFWLLDEYGNAVFRTGINIFLS